MLWNSLILLFLPIIRNSNAKALRTTVLCFKLRYADRGIVNAPKILHYFFRQLWEINESSFTLNIIFQTASHKYKNIHIKFGWCRQFGINIWEVNEQPSISSVLSHTFALMAYDLFDRENKTWFHPSRWRFKWENEIALKKNLRDREPKWNEKQLKSKPEYAHKMRNTLTFKQWAKKVG